MRALRERITLLFRLTRSVAFAALGDVAVVSPALAGCVYESEHGLDQAISCNTECNERGCTQNRLGSDTILVAENSACRECCANCADQGDQQGGADRESTRRCGCTASRGVGIHGCVRHPISTCVDENAAVIEIVPSFFVPRRFYEHTRFLRKVAYRPHSP